MHTIRVKQFVIRFRSFGVVSSKLENLGQEVISSVLDIWQDIVQRVFQLQAACQYREQMADTRGQRETLLAGVSV